MSNILDSYQPTHRFRVIPLKETSEKYMPEISDLESRIQALEKIIRGAHYGSKKIAVKTKQGYALLHPAEIILCTAAGNYTKINMENGLSYIVAKPLKEIYLSLPQDLFIRTHQSFAVNKSKVEVVDFSQNLLTLITGDSIPISRMKKHIVKSELLNS